MVSERVGARPNDHVALRHLGRRCAGGALVLLVLPPSLFSPLDEAVGHYAATRAPRWKWRGRDRFLVRSLPFQFVGMIGCGGTGGAPSPPTARQQLSLFGHERILILLERLSARGGAVLDRVADPSDREDPPFGSSSRDP